MIRCLTIQGYNIPFILQKNPQYSVRLIFESSFFIIETSTGQIDDKILKFIYDKSEWILKHYLTFNKEQLVNKLLQEGKIWLLGKLFNYKYVQSKNNFFRFENQELIIFTKISNPDIKTIYKVIRAFSKKFLTHKTFVIAQEIGLFPNQVTIRVQNTLWGSCSSQKKINLNWRLIFLEPSHIDYVIIHELCHLKHMNHNLLFWDLVESFCPYYKESEKYLKENHWVLNIYKE